MADIYAIIESGGKQYRAAEGQILLVDRLKADEGAKVNLRAVMFRDSDDTVLDSGKLEKVKVEAVVSGHERGKKIRVFKYKSKKGYRKRQGHRSELTRLEVTEVKMLTRKPTKAAEKREAGGSKPDADAAAAEIAAEKPAVKEPATGRQPTEKPAASKAPAKMPAAKKKPAAKKPAREKKES